MLPATALLLITNGTNVLGFHNVPAPCTCQTLKFTLAVPDAMPIAIPLTPLRPIPSVVCSDLGVFGLVCIKIFLFVASGIFAELGAKLEPAHWPEDVNPVNVANE